jgi:hypothetical protein
VRWLLVVPSICAALLHLPAQRVSTRDVLRAAGSYSERYHEAFTTIVAEEHYVQHATSPSSKDSTAQTRILRSDVMLIRGAAGESAWFFFRDVFEVDGRPVSGTRGRLESWYQESRDSFMHKARALALEQARFNLGDILRTINAPLFPLELLLPRHQDRFRFRLSGNDVVNGTAVITVTFQERRRPTMIRTLTGDDVDARGTFWIEPATGRVLKSELRTGEANRRDVQAVITVTYGANERLMMLVPVSMEETYDFTSIHITGTASYSNFRRFETDARIIRSRVPARAAGGLGLRHSVLPAER